MSYQQTMKDFRNAIFDLTKETIGHSRIYPARTAFIKPKTDYITYRVANITPMNSPGALPDTDTEKNRTYIVYEILVDIEAIDPAENAESGTSQATCARIRHGLDIEEIHYQYLSKNNIGFLRASTISDTSSVIDGEHWEQRAAFTSVFNVIVVQSDCFDTGGHIEIVEVTTNIDGGSSGTRTDTDIITSKICVFPLEIPFCLS